MSLPRKCELLQYPHPNYPPNAPFPPIRNLAVGFLIVRRPRPRRGFRGECCQLTVRLRLCNSRTEDEYLWTLMAVRRHISKPVTQKVTRSLARMGDNGGCVLVNRGTLAKGTSGDATRCQWRRYHRYPVNDDGQGACYMYLCLKLWLWRHCVTRLTEFVQLDSSGNTYTVAVAELQCNCGWELREVCGR